MFAHKLEDMLSHIEHLGSICHRMPRARINDELGPIESLPGLDSSAEMIGGPGHSRQASARVWEDRRGAVAWHGGTAMRSAGMASPASAAHDGSAPPAPPARPRPRARAASTLGCTLSGSAAARRCRARATAHGTT